MSEDLKQDMVEIVYLSCLVKRDMVELLMVPTVLYNEEIKESGIF